MPHRMHYKDAVKAFTVHESLYGGLLRPTGRTHRHTETIPTHSKGEPLGSPLLCTELAGNRTRNFAVLWWLRLHRREDRHPQFRRSIGNQRQPFCRRPNLACAYIR